MYLLQFYLNFIWKINTQANLKGTMLHRSALKLASADLFDLAQVLTLYVWQEHIHIFIEKLM